MSRDIIDALYDKKYCFVKLSIIKLLFNWLLMGPVKSGEIMLLIVNGFDCRIV